MLERWNSDHRSNLHIAKEVKLTFGYIKPRQHTSKIQREATHFIDMIDSIWVISPFVTMVSVLFRFAAFDKGLHIYIYLHLDWKLLQLILVTFHPSWPPQITGCKPGSLMNGGLQSCWPKISHTLPHLF